MLPLTAPNPELDRLIRRTPAGMMFWSGTCADPAATCGGCKHYGYEAVTRNEAGNVVCARKYNTSCALYKKHAGQHGASLDPKTLACKYFAARQP
jgi:hypothetical protein